MVLRWGGTMLLEAERRFRRIVPFRRQRVRSDGRKEIPLERLRLFQTAFVCLPLFGLRASVWLEQKKSRVCEAHYRNLRSLGERYWIPYFRSRRLRDIDHEMVADYLRRRKAGLLPGSRGPTSVTTANQDRKDLAAFFNSALRLEWVSRNPVNGTDRFSGAVKRHSRYLTPEEEERLLRECEKGAVVTVTAKRNKGGRRGGKVSKQTTTFDQRCPAPDWLRPMVLVAMRSGLRKGTLLQLACQPECLAGCEVALSRRYAGPGDPPD